MGRVPSAPIGLLLLFSWWRTKKTTAGVWGPGIWDRMQQQHCYPHSLILGLYGPSGLSPANYTSSPLPIAQWLTYPDRQHSSSVGRGLPVALASTWPHLAVWHICDYMHVCFASSSWHRIGPYHGYDSDTWLRVQSACVEKFSCKVDVDVTKKENHVASFPNPCTHI